MRGARLLVPDRSAPGGLPLDDSRPVDVWRGELGRRRRAPPRVAQRDRDGRHRGAQVGGPHAAPPGRRRPPPPPLRGHGRRRLGRPHRHRGQRADAHPPPRQPGRRRRSRTTTCAAAAPPLVGAGGRWGRRPGRLARRPPASASGRPCPGASARPDQVRPQASRAETQRRAAIGALALVAVVLLLGLFVILVPRGGDAARYRAGGQRRLSARPWRSTAPTAPTTLLATEPEAALEYYREAWAEVERARNTGLSAPALDELERRVRAGLDGLYQARTLVTRAPRLAARRSRPGRPRQRTPAAAPTTSTAPRRS